METAVVFDLEYWTDKGVMASKWSRPGAYRELTEIGAVRIDLDTLEPVEVFHRIAQPVFSPLTPYMLDLCKRTAADFEQAPFAPEIIKDFFEFTGSDTTFCYGEDGRVLVENLALYRVNGFALNDAGKTLRVTFDKSEKCEERENDILLALYGAQAEVAHRLSRGTYYLALEMGSATASIKVVDILPFFTAAGIDTKSVSSGRLASLVDPPMTGHEHHPVWDAKSVAYAAARLIESGQENIFDTARHRGTTPSITAMRPFRFSHPAASVAAPPYPGHR